MKYKLKLCSSKYGSTNAQCLKKKSEVELIGKEFTGKALSCNLFLNHKISTAVQQPSP